MVRKNLLYLFLLFGACSHAQSKILPIDSTIKGFRGFPESEPDSITVAHITNSLNGKHHYPIIYSSKRKWLVGGGTAALYGTSFIYLNEAWYKDYPRSSFHSFNDSKEWLQMDKIGHVWTAYTTSRATSALWKWTGVNDKTAVLLGSGSSLLYMLSIEYLDGRSAEWGWSWADVAADFAGGILYGAQELKWKDQKIAMKFSAHKKNYRPALNERAEELFGKGFYERMLKDYNAQTYWLSFNINSFMKNKKLPDWLNLSIGYGADGMFGGHENLAYDDNRNIVFDRRDISRFRQWYFAPDVDLTKIKTNSKVLRTVFFALNSFKFPTPALELSNGKLRGRWLQF